MGELELAIIRNRRVLIQKEHTPLIHNMVVLPVKHGNFWNRLELVVHLIALD
jgi:hypothetical protein